MRRQLLTGLGEALEIGEEDRGGVEVLGLCRSGVLQFLCYFFGQDVEQQFIATLLLLQDDQVLLFQAVIDLLFEPVTTVQAYKE